MPDKIWTSFGPWLQRQREQSGVSQGKVAERAGVHVIQLSRIENGRSGIKRPTLQRIVEAVNEMSTGHKIDLDDALDRAGFSRQGSERVEFDIGGKARLALLDADLTPEDQKEILDEMALAYEVVMARRQRRQEEQERRK